MTGGERTAVAAGCAVAGMLFTLAVSHWIAQRPVPLGAERGAASPPVTVSATRSALWLLAVGVSRHQQPDLNIQFPDDDARAIAAALGAQSNGSLYRQVRTLVLTNEQVTREAVLDAMEHFLGQAGRDDVAAIFLAGPTRAAERRGRGGTRGPEEHTSC
jgi:hypothetical protein